MGMDLKALARKGPAYATGVLMLSLLSGLASTSVAAVATPASKSTIHAHTVKHTATTLAAKPAAKPTTKPAAKPAHVSAATRGAVRDARAISHRTGMHVTAHTTPPARVKVKRNQFGVASFYGPEFAERKTASGEPFDPRALTAAHRTLPLGTRVRVTNLENGKQTVVRINDRGPYRNNRVIDLSRAAARKLGFVQDGIAHVRIEVLKPKRGDRTEYPRAESARLAAQTPSEPDERSARAQPRVKRGDRCNLSDAPKRERT